MPSPNTTSGIKDADISARIAALRGRGPAIKDFGPDPCPHCGASKGLVGINLPTEPETNYCLTCHSYWRDGQDEHTRGKEVHSGLCRKKKRGNE